MYLGSWKRNMNSKKEIYKIEFTEDAREEIREIYEYISKNLVNKEAAKRLMKKMRENVMNLAETPEIYKKIEKKDRIKREFRRMVVDNYIILYTIDESKKIIYISHMYYQKRNYLQYALKNLPFNRQIFFVISDTITKETKRKEAIHWKYKEK